MTRVAWVIVNHNGGQELLDTVQSLTADMSPADLLVLVDNGSTDGSAASAKVANPSLELIQSETNLPFSAAVNLGLSQALEAGARFVGMLNPDVRIQLGMTDKLVERLERSNCGSIVSPLMLNPQGKIWFAGGRVLWPLAMTMHRCIGRSPSKNCAKDHETQYLTGCCILAGSTVWRSVGMLDEEYVFYGEDAEWSWRARRQGFRLELVADARLTHNISNSSGGGRTEIKMLYRTVATRRFFCDHSLPFWRVVQRVGRPLAEAAYALFLLLRGEERALAVYRHALSLDETQRMPWPPSR